MIILSLKYTVSPLLSVNLPSSSICKKISSILGFGLAAFSISSNNITLNGFSFIAFVNCPPCSYPTYPGGAPINFWSEFSCAYSLISNLIQACSSPNKNLASAFESSVLPTPVGPTKKNTPFGIDLLDVLCKPVKPIYALTTVFSIFSIASSCPTTLSDNFFLIFLTSS